MERHISIYKGSSRSTILESYNDARMFLQRIWVACVDSRSLVFRRSTSIASKASLHIVQADGRRRALRTWMFLKDKQYSEHLNCKIASVQISIRQIEQ